jgi:hypothetical protein
MKNKGPEGPLSRPPNGRGDLTGYARRHCKPEQLEIT